MLCAYRYYKAQCDFYTLLCQSVRWYDGLPSAISSSEHSVLPENRSQRLLTVVSCSWFYLLHIQLLQGAPSSLYILLKKRLNNYICMAWERVLLNSFAQKYTCLRSFRQFSWTKETQTFWKELFQRGDSNLSTRIVDPESCWSDHFAWIRVFSPLPASGYDF